MRGLFIPLKTLDRFNSMGDHDDNDLPFRGEYAKSGRASCKACKNTIDKGELRIAVMVQVRLSKSF